MKHLALVRGPGGRVGRNSREVRASPLVNIENIAYGVAVAFTGECCDKGAFGQAAVLMDGRTGVRKLLDFKGETCET